MGPVDDNIGSTAADITGLTVDAIYDEIPAVCIHLDSRLNIRNINQFGCQYLGYTKDELCNKPVRILCGPDDADIYQSKLKSCLSGDIELRRFESVRLRNDGSSYWVRDTVRKLSGYGEESQLLIVSEDITETRYLITELERQSAIDPLTGLNNRRSFDRDLEQAVLTASITATTHVLCFIDLDQFKIVNDSCGHLAGDELLRQIARILQKQIRGKDILARLGGDEFGLILESCSIDEARTICNKILAALNAYRFSWNSEIFSLGASIGILLVDAGSPLAVDLMRFADTACYMAKDLGRNCIKVYDELDSDTVERGELIKWSSRLQAALDQNNFELHCQGMQCLKKSSDETSRFELLVRMRNVNIDLIYPGSFIPAAEYYDLIGSIDRWVVQQAVKSIAARNKNNENVQYFINLSGKTLTDTDFIDEITSLLKKYPSAATSLCFEITETAAIQNLTSAIEFMEHFKRLGCQFALDDFGTGFSSFAYLKALPVDYIKIDGEFIRNLIQEPMQFAIVQAIHLIADVSRMETIAEHVEDGAIVNVLRGLGIDYAQGYYIDEPHILKCP